MNNKMLVYRVSKINPFNFKSIKMFTIENIIIFFVIYGIGCFIYLIIKSIWNVGVEPYEYKEKSKNKKTIKPPKSWTNRKEVMRYKWDKMQETKENRPYLKYITVGDARTRPEHEVLDGIIRHIDDPFWISNYPPNGKGCRCTVITLSESQLQREGSITSKNELKRRLRQAENLTKKN